MKKLDINKIKGIFNQENQQSVDSTFNRLRDLQVLLKKESALKELCNQIKIII